VKKSARNIASLDDERGAVTTDMVGLITAGVALSIVLASTVATMVSQLEVDFVDYVDDVRKEDDTDDGTDVVFGSGDASGDDGSDVDPTSGSSASDDSSDASDGSLTVPASLRAARMDLTVVMGLTVVMDQIVLASHRMDLTDLTVVTDQIALASLPTDLTDQTAVMDQISLASLPTDLTKQHCRMKTPRSTRA
jgi:hypothetical protein